MITLTATITMDNGDTIEITPQNALSMERSIFDRSDTSMPSWGIISNGGSLRFVDGDGSIKILAESQLLKSGMKVNIYLENTISTAKGSIGEFYTTKWDYDVDNREVSVTFEDDLKEWQNIPSSKIPLQTSWGATSSNKSKTALDIAKILYRRTPEKYKPINDILKHIDEKTQTFLENYKIYYPYLDEGTLWSQWNKLCELCALNIFKNNKNKFIIMHN